MGKEFNNLTIEEMCDLMCGKPEKDYEDEDEPIVEFVSYDGSYPNLCSGTLLVKIDGKPCNLGNCLISGGCTGFTVDWDAYIEYGEWTIYTEDIVDRLPEKYRNASQEEFDNLIGKIAEVVNENVPAGCCGGCI